MTYRERRERRAERLRGWAAKREADAAATFAAHEVYRGDVAFNTQPGHIPERARVIAREDRAIVSLRKAERMQERADNIDGQLAGAIYSDDPDAIERLVERIAGLEAQRERYKAYNASARRGAPDESLLDEAQRAELASMRKYEWLNRRGGAFPPYVLSNLAGNIGRQRERLEDLKRKAGPRLAECLRNHPDTNCGHEREPERLALVKVAVIRDPAPIGEPGFLHLNCPCGANPPTVWDGPDVLCACGVTYASNGWRR